MRKFLVGFIGLLTFFSTSLFAQRMVVSDSLFATGYLITVQPGFSSNVKYWNGGILGATIYLVLQKNKSKSSIEMWLPENALLVSMGEGIKKNKNKIIFPYPVNPQNDYKLMLITAADSSGNATLYSGYAYLPELQKWKLVATISLPEYKKYLHPVATTEAQLKGLNTTAIFKENWMMDKNGKWKDVDGKNPRVPEINLVNHADSAARVTIDAGIIQKRVATDMKYLTAGQDGLYYHILEKGNGTSVRVTDSVKVFYKGYLLENGEVFDQTKQGVPARFPLARLIKGWQLGVPLVNVGGKIQLVIPSHLAYGIRTRSPKIPPNSILVFDIEVVGVD